MGQINNLKNKLQSQPSAQIRNLNSQAIQSPIFFSGGYPVSRPIQSTPKTGQNSSPVAIGNTTSSEKNSADQQKINFLSSNDTTQNAEAKVVSLEKSKNTLMAGTYLHAVLKTSINSDLPGNLQAVIANNIYDSRTGTHLLIPAGTRLLGEYNSQVTYGQERVQAVFNRLIRPDLTSITLSNPQGINGDGITGLSGDVNNHWGRVIGSALLVSLFNVPQALFQQSELRQPLGYPCPPGYGYCPPPITIPSFQFVLKSHTKRKQRIHSNWH